MFIGGTWCTHWLQYHQFHSIHIVVTYNDVFSGTNWTIYAPRFSLELLFFSNLCHSKNKQSRLVNPQSIKWPSMYRLINYLYSLGHVLVHVLIILKYIWYGLQLLNTFVFWLVIFPWAFWPGIRIVMKPLLAKTVTNKNIVFLTYYNHNIASQSILRITNNWWNVMFFMSSRATWPEFVRFEFMPV